MRDFRFLCLTAPGAADPSVAAAASRAGALGILDLELACDEPGALLALGRLARLARADCGVKLDGTRIPFLDAVARALPERVRTIILTPGDPAFLRPRIGAWRAAGIEVLLEAVSMEEAALGADLAVDGLIAKGHEAAGRVGDETTFILLQRLLAHGSLPVFAQGGIGLHTAAAVCVAGAAGIVLDAQLLLTRESPLGRAARETLARMDGSETTLFGSDLGETWRLYDRSGHAPSDDLRGVERVLHDGGPAGAGRRADWRRAIAERTGWDDPKRRVMVLGQDAAFAASLAKSFRTVGGVVEGMRRAIESHLKAARTLKPLDAGSPLALSHGTRYPVVQGPMTRVSDTAPFALEVAKGGGLPFLALALMRKAEVRALLEETRRVMGDRPWGVGILGFVPIELRQEQLDAIDEFHPPFALIAGGRPDQAKRLERDGIATYLHVPSPGLLKLFLEGGSRRFVFEGRECGGHVGPRSSFVLWNSMVDTLLESLPADQLAECHVLFAAGIHDALSASMVAALAAPLAERGARVGVLLGTAYLFTEEAVTAGAIVPGFQESAVRCRRTVLLETGPGHSTRCVDSPFAASFESERRRLASEGRPAEEIRNALEALNLGRLRIASKGVDRNPGFGSDPGAPKLRPLTSEEQRVQGMFMIGQVAALRDTTCTIEALHRDVSVGSTARLAESSARAPVTAGDAPREKPSDIAIVGMACLLPKAPGLGAYWENILDKVDAITEVPADRWDWKRYFDPDPKARDRVYSKWGGFIDDVAFDPMRYGMPPNSLPSIEPVQLLTLEVARAALEDAGYLDRAFPRDRTSVILGAGGGISELGNLYAFRSQLPSFIDAPLPDLMARLPEWTEDSFPGILLNVAAGRVANRFDLGGANFTVDAACASSLAALYLAVKDLETGSSDMALAGGIDTAQNPFMFLCFSKTRAHSPRGRCRTFDETADGIVISEGLAILVLKRLADAERDGDRIYAVIKSIAASSDGRDKGLTAPRPEGQMRALDRAYAKAGFSPATVGLIEAHGTGTVAGDQAETTTLKRVFEAAGAARQSCAIGSVKSMIGHTKCTAGVAGMAKVALALYHKVLPPTLNVEKPNATSRLEESPFYVNSELRPWLSPAGGHARRAGVSAFGFGGTNFHAVLEEYADEIALDRPALRERSAAELFLWRGQSRQEIEAAAGTVQAALGRGARPEPADLSWTLWRRAAERPDASLTLAVIASSAEELGRKLQTALERLRAGATSIFDPSGTYFTEAPFGRGGRIAFLFPGQGSQYPDMLRDLAVRFPEVRLEFERAESALAGRLPQPLGRFVFPPPAFTPEAERARREALTQTQVAQPALGAAGMAALRLLRLFGVRPDMVAGHSYGEYAALCAAGVFDEETLARLSEARGRSILEAAKDDLGTMAAIAETPARIAEALRPIKDVWIANLNAPRQTVISGTRAGVQQAIDRLKQDGIEARPLPVACAFHSPVIAPARDRLAAVLSEVTFAAPRLEVFSNSTAAAYPRDPKSVAALLAEHLVEPVRFADEIEAMHQAGARLFVEVGPKNVLTGLTQQILSERPHLAVASDVPGRPGPVQLLHLLGQLAAHAVAIDLDRLFLGRTVRDLDLNALESATAALPLSPATWMVNGASARPLGQPPRRLEPISLPEAGSPESFSPEPSAAEPPVAPAVAATDATQGEDPTAQVILQFQQMMGRFLDTQKEVMRSFLEGTGAAAQDSPVEPMSISHLPARPAAAAAALAVAASTPIPARSEAPAPQPGPAVASAHAVSAAVPAHAAGSVMTASLSADELKRRLLAIVGDRTGYPSEMLDLDLNIEADLGIDSIKRVEILGAFQRACPADLQTRLQDAMESLSRIRTLRGILDLAAAAGGTAAAAPPVAPASAAPSAPAAAPAPSPMAAVPAPAAGSVTTSLSADELKRRLLAIVGDRTGYPPEMLDLDLNIEADLGIDSIKRVEILGAFQRACPADLQARLQDAMESLSRIRTLRGILDLAAAAGSVTAAPEIKAPAPSAAPAPPGEPSAPSGTRFAPTAGAAPEPAQDVPRFLLRAVELPAAGGTVYAPGNLAVLITDDGRGTARALAAMIQERGGRAITIDLADETRLAEAVADARGNHGPIGALVHLRPLAAVAAGEDIDPSAWKTRIDREVLSLFDLVRAARPDLRDAGDAGRLLVATAMGGAYGLDPQPAGPFFPGQGGLTGLIKTVSREWPGTRCKAIDFDARTTPRERATLLLQEMAGGDDEVEVGYRGTCRIAVRPLPAPLPRDPVREPLPDSSWVFLITGGARGITAEIAEEIAAQYRPTLVVTGRSPLPEAAEPAATSTAPGPREIKSALIEEARRSGTPQTPAAIEAALKRILQDREIRAHLEAMRRAGATVRYEPVDARDERAFSRLIDDLYRDYGRIDAVIHGAGVIEDKLIEDKTPASFDRVFGTKVDGALTLARRLRPEDLKLFALFASVAGRFGNAGQCDYAAANETLTALALHLDRAWPGRVLSIHWGPWRSGMASAEVQERFAARGVQLVSPAGGRPAFIREIERGAKGEVAVVLGDGPWRAYADAASAATGRAGRSALPLLEGLQSRASDGGGIEIRRLLDPATDLFLLDHQMDGRPVLPAAMAMELFAEIARHGWPEWEVQAIQEFRVLNGVVLKDGPRPIVVRARAATQPGQERLELSVDVVIADPESGRPCYQATVLLGDRLASAASGPLAPLREPRPYPTSVESAYENLLFHGPLFQGIRTIHGLGDEGISGTVLPSTPARCVRGADGGGWLIDPVVVDSAFQLGILYARSHYDMTPLPARFRSFRRYAPFNGSPIRCEFRSVARAGGHVLDIQIAFLDGEGRLLGMLEDMELSCSRELNRLAGPRGRG
jgi:acyl transferase domain-containing protein/NAD(P)H-dependent flavin oxidoreductase YrpB (nitropropane dioxygenase family)/NAD(P)-dependent dehydrogenase (short-subunit alcohol dehydrogenase family)